MKKGRKITALLLALVAAGTMTAGLTACKNGGSESETQEQTLNAEKLKDGEAIAFTDGVATIDLAQFVRANGNGFKASSSNPSVVQVSLSGSTLTVTVAGEGSAIVTVTCGDVRLTFSATVPKQSYTITLDGQPVLPAEGDKWAAGASYTLPEAKEAEDENFEFKGWDVNGERKNAEETITVNRNLTITAVFERKAAEEVSGHAQQISLNAGKTTALTISDYITAYGREVTATFAADDDGVAAVVSNEEGVVTVSGVGTGNATLTLQTEGVTVELTVQVLAADIPTFADVTESIDPFSEEAAENSYTLTLKAEDEHFTYTYEIGGTAVSGNRIYTAEADETVTVNYAYKGDTAKKGTASFTVKITFDRTAFPTLKEESKTEDVDLALVKGGVYTPDLFGNFTNPENIEIYTVNGTAYTDGTSYTISNDGSTYGETATAVTYTVVATFKKSLGSLQYDYTVNVSDTSAFRMENGGFEDGTTGWTGATEKLSSADTYWENYSVNNDGQYYDGTDADTETVTSPSFTVGGSGWITFKFGSARPVDGNTLRNVHLEFYQVKAEGDEKIADVRNILFKDPEAALKLNDYKLDLSQYIGATVYVKAVDGEVGNGDFRFLILDGFQTYWKEAPTDAKYTDLTATHYFNLSCELDLKDTNKFTLNPVLSQGLTSNANTLTATVDREGLTIDSGNPLSLTATKSGTYTVTYKNDGDTVFTVTVTVKNTVAVPEFENQKLTVKKGESGTLNLPTPEEGSRFAYSYSVTEEGASIADGVLTFNSAEKEEGTYSVSVSVTVTDQKWGEDGDTFIRTFTVSVIVYGKKIIASELLTDGKASLSFDVYELKQVASDATTVGIDFAKYLIVSEGITVTYTVTRTIGTGEAASVTPTNGVYALPLADCDLTVNHVETATFEVTATNSGDSANTVAFTLTVSIKDTTGNRVVNGGFEEGFTGWTALTEGFDTETCVISDPTYWGEELPYNQAGSKHLDGFNTGIGEEETWSVRSSVFTLGGSGWITLRMGGHAAAVKIYKLKGDTVDATQDELIGYYKQTRFCDAHFNDGFLAAGGSWADMGTYAIDLTGHEGEKLYIELCDEAVSGWAHAFFDEVITYYETTPDWEHDKETVINAHKGGEPRDENDSVDIPWTLAQNELAPTTEE